MVIKPDKIQLQKMYPNVSADYISEHLDRKLLLIKAEDNVIIQINNLMSQFQEQIIGAIMLSTENKQKIIQSKLVDMEFQIADLEIDSIIQLHEYSGYLYQWLLEKYFGESISQEFGGEQDVSIHRKKLLKQDIQKMVLKTVSRSHNVSSSIDSALSSLQNDIIRFSAYKNVSIADINRSFKKAKRSIGDATRSILQQSVYDAERNTNIYISDDYQIVYYRVEVLDSSICMCCLQIDGSINDHPLGLIHKNCRGIDIVLLKDLETGKYYDTSHKGYGHKLKTKTFEQKFESLSERQKRNMLGKSNYELYATGQLSPSDFLSNGRQITNAEAKIKGEIKALRKLINTPRKATDLANYIESMFKNPVSKMSSEELLAYEKCLGLQRQLYEIVPTKAYSKLRSKQSYMDAIDAKYKELNKIKLERSD